MLFRTLPLVALAGLALCAEAQAPSQADLFDRMAAHVEAHEADLVALRHDIHRHPEVSGEEERTAGLVAARLTALGFDVHTGVGGHGVVGVLEGGRPGPLVAFRADLDAVRSGAPDPVAYRSEIPGVRHICGHDVHTTIGVALAEAFAAVREDLAGSVMLVFQPAEERGTGAKAMLADGAFDGPVPDAIFAVHTAPMPVGQVATVAGGMMAGRAGLSVALSGNGDLGDAAAQVRAAVASVGTFAPQNPGQIAPAGFVTVQLFGGGDASVRGQIMTAGPADRDRAKAEVLAALDALDLPGVVLDVAYDERLMEGVTNDESLVAVANAGIGALAPDIAVGVVPGAVPYFSEDFGSFQALTPGVMYFLGVSNPEAGTVGMPHSPDYVADDAAIAVGTRAMLAAMLQRLAEG
ncbi:M20 metallopeptidase family protein [Rubrivirga sp. IMCC43871]|uniref:M20 metallopeptidase family protein n=1 Tax=Rubrivirga sp. IMCC43871 TaxID=3391575 RepID=UPI00398FDE0C